MADKITLGGLEKMSDQLAKIDFLTLCACGTSLNASRYAEKLMKHLGSFDVVHSVDAAEVEPSDFPQKRENQLLFWWCLKVEKQKMSHALSMRHRREMLLL